MFLESMMRKWLHLDGEPRLCPELVPLLELNKPCGGVLQQVLVPHAHALLPDLLQEDILLMTLASPQCPPACM
jgi:wyosine [tRNA(Phe)-imidazoG37] synthetase (radical SAM superfamily)